MALKEFFYSTISFCVGNNITCQAFLLDFFCNFVIMEILCNMLQYSYYIILAIA